MDSTPIREFYKNQTVFITGGTGFVGNALIEKLLRTCQISTIYLLIRPKKDDSVEERFEKLFSSPCFDLLKSKSYNFKTKVKFVSGDCSKENLGLDENDWNLLVENVSVVIHSAADVRFDTSLSKAAQINVRAVRDILRLSRQMVNLKCMVHVSTAFSQHYLRDIEDTFYDPPVDAETLLKIVDFVSEDHLKIVTPRLVEKWRNTYVYTKAVAEDLIRREGTDLPVAVVRPALITCSAEEPMRGWFDNFYGPIGFTIGLEVGVISCIHMKIDKDVDWSPVDYVTNLILAVAWKTGLEKTNDSLEKREPKIYNFAGSKTNPLTWRQGTAYAKHYIPKYPTNLKLWETMYVFNKNELVYNFTSFLLHTVPAFVADFLLLFAGKRPKVAKGMMKFHRVAKDTAYFRLHQWNWSDGNWKNLWMAMSEKDKEMFKFDYDQLHWREYVESWTIGGRVYLLKDPLETLEKAKKRARILKVVHWSFLGLLWLVLFSVCFGFKFD